MTPAEELSRHSGPIPVQAGIGLRAPHYRELLEQRPDIGWVEVHSENYFGSGGQPFYYLERVRQHYPLSLHGVGLSLGSTDSLDGWHLERLRSLISRVEPALVSEHLSWGSVGGRYLNDLLPLPYTEEALRHVSGRIEQVQESLGRTILIENISSYLQFTHSTIPEWEFLAQLTRQTGCGLLLDVNNLYVNSMNHGVDVSAYLRGIPSGAVQEIHLAVLLDTGECLIDTHGSRVHAPVWALYREAIGIVGARPSLIEWDTDLPPLGVLLEEARKADVLADR